MSLEQGKKLISIARSTIKKAFSRKGFELEKKYTSDEKLNKNEKLNKRMGVFVTLHTFPKKELRGCIGFISPLPLWEGVQRAAYSSAFNDPRFPSLSEDEFEKIIVEVSVLTEPRPLKCDPKEYEKSITIGEDGLILQNGPYSGLLLPQVPVEQKWSAKEYLRNLCYKAGLTPGFLYDENTELWKFQAQIFAEKEPNGEVEEVKHK